MVVLNVNDYMCKRTWLCSMCSYTHFEKKNMHLFSCNTYPSQKNGEQADKRHLALTVQERSVHALLAISLAFLFPGLGMEPTVSCTLCAELRTSRASSLGLLAVGWGGDGAGCILKIKSG